MTDSDQKNYGMMDFYEKYEDYTDEQILDVLRNHKDYQDGAVNAAVKIAVERQLIHSEQDLLSPEFQSQRKIEFMLFPLITDVHHRQRLVASIFRFLYVLSLVPLIYGLLKYGEGFPVQTYLGIGVSAAWFALTVLLRRTKKAFFFFLLFALLLAVAVLTGLKVFAAPVLPVLDLVMFAISILLPTYMLSYLWILIGIRSGSNQ